MTTKTHHAEIPFRWRVEPPTPPIARIPAPPPEQGASGDNVASYLHLGRILRPLEASHA